MNETEALVRAIEEIQALSIIYNDDDDALFDDGLNHENFSKSFQILSIEEYRLAQHLVDTEFMDLNESNHTIPDLRLEINLNIALDDSGSSHCTSKIHITLPRGYPNVVSAFVSIVSIDNLNSNRKERDNFSAFLNDKARELCESDSEALMELIQYAQENIFQYIPRPKLQLDSPTSDIAGGKGIRSENAPHFSRRWIWVHHVTNEGRRKDILKEARGLKLSGYLKRGYPGVIVVEGESQSCDEYVQWIKGNKSRPGGFGRNWGHHVRGEVELESTNEAGLDGGLPLRAFVNDFEDIGEDLGELAKMCRDVDLEDEFKKYVMQH